MVNDGIEMIQERYIVTDPCLGKNISEQIMQPFFPDVSGEGYIHAQNILLSLGLEGLFFLWQQYGFHIIGGQKLQNRTISIGIKIYKFRNGAFYKGRHFFDIILVFHLIFPQLI